MASSSNNTSSECKCLKEIDCGGVKVQIPTNLYINGEWVESKSKKRFASINPATEETIVEVAEALAEDVDYAVSCARKAFNDGWRESGPTQRRNILDKIVELLKRDQEKIAALETLDNGKPLTLSAHVDIPLVIDCFQYYSGFTNKYFGNTYQADGAQFHYTRREPVGVCGQIIPWNFPLLMLAWKIAPALATGNVVILKSAEQTPLTALYFSKICHEAGVPPGVVNIISGFGPTAGSALANHMDIDKVAFTGSTAVGKLILKASAESNLKKVSLELGGKSPNIVFADANLDVAIEQSWNGVFFNQGQVCTAGSRIFVEESIHDKFVEKFKEKATKQWSVGNPFDIKTAQGPQVSKRQFNTVMSYIEKGKKEGANLLCGGGRACDKGYFIQPTIFTDVKDNHTIAKEEIFGPVSSILKFNADNIEEVLKRANNTKYGLAAAVFTRDISKAHKIAHRLNAGTVWINQYNQFTTTTPFGGYKSSGLGRECGETAIELYTQIKTVKVNLDF